MSENLGNLHYDIDLNTKPLEAGLSRSKQELKGAAKHTGDLDDSTKKLDSSHKSLSDTLKSNAKLLVGFGALGALKMGIDIVREFEKNMSVLGVSLSATSAEMEKLTAKSIELGSDISLPGTSAGDAAEAMTELAKAGLSVNDTLEASRGVLELSAAGQLSNAEAATVTANALNAFGLEGKEATRVADLLSGAANSSSASVKSLSDGFAQASAAFAIAGFQIDELATAIAALSNKGIAGSDAGTSLKTFIASIGSPSKAAREEMEKLSLKFTDAHGNFLSLSEISQKLKVALDGLSESEKINALATIFGNDASRAAGVLAENGAAGFDKLSKSVNEQGAAAKLAAAQNAGLGGIIDGIKSTVETFALTVGEDAFPKIAPALKSISEAAGSAAGVLGPLLGTGFTVVGKAADALMPVLNVGLDVLGLLTPVVSLLGKTLSIIPTPVLAIVAAMRLGNMAFDKFDKTIPTKKIIEMGNESTGAVSKLKRFGTELGNLSSNSGLASRAMTKFKDVNTNALISAGLAYRQFSGEGITAMEALKARASSAGGDIKSTLGNIAGHAKSAGAGIVNALGGPLMIGLEVGMVALSGYMNSVAEAEKKTKALKKEARDAAKELRFDTVAGTGLGRTMQVLDALIAKNGEVAKSLTDIQDGYKNISAGSNGFLEQLKGGAGTNTVANLINDSKEYTKAMAELKKQAKDAGMFGSGVWNKATRTVGGTLGTDKEGQDAEKAYTDMARVYEATKKTQLNIFKENAKLAKEMGKGDLAATFERQAKLLKKGGDLDDAYMNTIEATRKLNVAQEAIVDNALRVELGLDKSNKKVKQSGDVQLAVIQKTSELKGKLDEVAKASTKVTVATAIENANPRLLAQASAEYLSLAAKNLTAAEDYAVKFANQLGIDPEKSDEVAQELVAFKDEFIKNQGEMLKEMMEKVPSMDDTISDKFEVKKGGPSLGQIAKNRETLRIAQEEFNGYIKTLIANGQGDLARELAKAGIENGYTAAKEAAAGQTKATTLALENLKTNTALLNTSTADLGTTYKQALQDAYGGEITLFPNVKINPKVETPEKKINIQSFMNGTATAQDVLSFRFFEAKAKGGPVNANQPYIVGEKGPELFVPNGMGNIIPADKTSSMLNQASSKMSSGQSGNTYINVDMSKVMAVSRTQVREVGNTFIEAVNEGLIARGIAPIADNKIRSAS